MERAAPSVWNTPPLPLVRPPRAFRPTIADLGEFEADSWPRRCRAWADATVAGWLAGVATSAP